MASKSPITLPARNLWFEANRQAIETFPACMFLPGFWSEFGMCTEPSAFGAVVCFRAMNFRSPIKSSPRRANRGIEGAEPGHGRLAAVHAEPAALGAVAARRPGPPIRFSVSRGPLNVASFLMGTTEFLMALKTDPEAMHRLLRLITSFLKKWHALQRETFPTVNGIMILDDLVGFVGEEDFVEFGLPYLRELYAADAAVKFFHNDAPCAKSLKYYADAGINLFNPGVHHSLNELKAMSGNRLAILGGLPPRDVLARGTPAEVRAAVRKLLAETQDHTKLILSCNGGMPPGVSTENIRAFIEAVRS